MKGRGDDCTSGIEEEEVAMAPAELGSKGQLPKTEVDDAVIVDLLEGCQGPLQPLAQELLEAGSIPGVGWARLDGVDAGVIAPIDQEEDPPISWPPEREDEPIGLRLEDPLKEMANQGGEGRLGALKIQITEGHALSSPVGATLAPRALVRDIYHTSLTQGRALSPAEGRWDTSRGITL